MFRDFSKNDKYTPVWRDGIVIDGQLKVINANPDKNTVIIGSESNTIHIKFSKFIDYFIGYSKVFSLNNLEIILDKNLQLFDFQNITIWCNGNFKFIKDNDKNITIKNLNLYRFGHMSGDLPVLSVDKVKEPVCMYLPFGCVFKNCDITVHNIYLEDIPTFIDTEMSCGEVYYTSFGLDKSELVNSKFNFEYMHFQNGTWKLASEVDLFKYN